MNRRTFFRATGAVAFGTTLLWSTSAGAQADRPSQKRPNFVFFLVDDLGWADVGCFRSGVANADPTIYETPCIDRLATQGMRFTDAYAACPVCSPTRASILTGKHPVRVGITDWIPGSDPKNRKLLAPQDLHQMPLAEQTIAETLRDAGYRTFFAGKWHLGGTGFFPENQGFDINKGGHHRGSPPGGYYAPYKNPKLASGPDGEYLPDRLADESILFIREQSRQRPEQPFLMYLSFYTVHTPIQACKRHLDRFKKKADALPPVADSELVRTERAGRTRARQDNAAYASMVHAMDENVGRVLDSLDKLGIADDTVVIFMSDNGGLSTKRNPGPTSNLPLRAGKGWCYEGGIREPVIIRAPGCTQPGTACSIPVTSMDFYPTMLELAGLPLRPAQHADGVSLVPLLKGAAGLEREAIFWHYPHYHGSTWAPGAAVRAGDWKLIEFYEEDGAELYNLTEDLGERRELSAQHPGKKSELLKLLHDWQTRMGAKMPAPNPAYGKPAASSKTGRRPARKTKK